MNKYTIIALPILLVSVLFIYVLFNKSFILYRQADELYKNGKINESYEIVQDSLKYYKFNRKSLYLKSKIQRYIKNEEKYKRALALYDSGSLYYKNGDLENAETCFREGLDLLTTIPMNIAPPEESKKLSEGFLAGLSEVLADVSNKNYNKALELLHKGDLLEAYSVILLTDHKDTKVTVLKSTIAYSIGKGRFYKVAAEGFKAKEHVLRDILYWLSQVDKSSEYYNESYQMIGKIKLYLEG